MRYGKNVNDNMIFNLAFRAGVEPKVVRKVALTGVSLADLYAHFGVELAFAA